MGAKAKVQHIENMVMDLEGCQEMQGEGWLVWVCVQGQADSRPEPSNPMTHIW